MKKIRTMFAIIAIVGIISAAFAFKAKKFALYCLYCTTVIWNEEDELPETVCKTLGHVNFTPYPNGVIFHAAYTTSNLCWNLPSMTPTQYCNNVYTLTILP